jgi:hypothetical protein
MLVNGVIQIFLLNILNKAYLWYNYIMQTLKNIIIFLFIIALAILLYEVFGGYFKNEIGSEDILKEEMRSVNQPHFNAISTGEQAIEP